jgi:ferredoxin-thioredoxin reductase catalytic subunit
MKRSRPKPLTKLSTPQAAGDYAQIVASHRGWVVNPDSSLTGPIIEGLMTQSMRYGKPYCPCRDVDGGDSDRDIICPCVYSAADIAEYGQCFCGLFLGLEKLPKTVGSIPERRP